MVSNTVVPRDPIYMAFGLGFTNSSNLSLDILDETSLYIVRETNNKINKDTLKARTGNLIKEFFDPSKNKLGQRLNFSELTNNILSIEGVKRIYTKNDNNSSSIDTVSFLSFNPVYETSDIALVNQDTTLPYFKFPYMYSPLSISNRIKVIDE